MPDLYADLGLSNNASKDDIKRAFKKLAIQHHPDKGGDEEAFKKISHAYEVLSDEEKRQRYDQTGQDGGQPDISRRGFNPFGDMFNQFGFNDHPHHQVRQVRLEDTVYVIDITLQEAYFGCEKMLNVTTTGKCSCSRDCPTCRGIGTLKIIQQFGPFRQVFETPCDACKSTGYLYDHKNCKKCNSTGKQEVANLCKVKIPRGCRNGMECRMKGKGTQAMRVQEVSGDLIFKIEVKQHPLFQRRDDDLIIKLDLSITDMICGAKIIIPHFEGNFEVDTSDINEEQVLRENKEYVVKEKGMISEEGIKGNLCIIFKLNPTKKGCLESEDIALIRRVFNKD